VSGLSLLGGQAKVFGKPLNIVIGYYNAWVAAAITGALAAVVIYFHGGCPLFFGDENIN